MWDYQDEDYYNNYEREDDIYSGQYHDDEDDWQDDPFQPSSEEQEKQVSNSEWIVLDTDPFSDSDYPKDKQRVLLWNDRHKKCYATGFISKIEWEVLGYTHWMPEPKGPVNLLNYSEVVKGLQCGKKYKRQHGMQTLYTTDSQVSVHDTQQEDWIEV